MIGKDFVKLGSVLKNINDNKIDFCILSNGEVFACIDKKVYNFRSLKKFVRDLNFLNRAKFTPKALESLDKEKTTKKKEFFLYWVANCVNYGHQKGRTLEDLRQEFNTLYSVEIKQGRKTNAERLERAQKRPDSSEELDQVGEDLEE